MREYSYDELQKMQEKALERVRNMQMYSREAVDNTNREQTLRSTPTPSQPTSPPPPAPAPKRGGGRIKMPLNLPENRDLTYPSFKDYFEPETQKTKQQAVQTSKANLFDTVLQEPDEAMLFSLLLLLKAEGADEALMMALLYIMS